MESSNSLFCAILCYGYLLLQVAVSMVNASSCLIASFDVLVFVCVFVYLKKQAFYFMTYLK